MPTLLRGDPGRLRQILTNLVGNAVKFTRTGEVVVYVSLAEEPKWQNLQSNGQESPGDVLLHFSVRDTGIGIPKEKTGLLFGKFSQVDSSTTRQYGGSGLGLVISKQLSELFGGETGVTSEEGKGSEFWFTARLALQTGVQPTACAPVDLKDVRVLIVDDNATNREILTKRLSSWGMQPSEAKDGPQALQVFYRALEENNPFRMALIDMQMPNMDGETLGKIIKMNPRLADARLVLLTSLGTRGDVRRFQSEGFSACVTKPIRHQEFRDILSMVLGSPLDASGRHIVAHQKNREIPGRFAARKVRILVAEDNITNQQVALGLLKNLGLSANAVANGMEVVKALETIPYDLVFMDVQMPELDGFEATRRVRSWKQESEGSTGHSRAGLRKRASSLPIIAMTAYALEGDRDRCLEAGMNDYISKPVSRKVLMEALEKWLPKEDTGSAGAEDVIDAAQHKNNDDGRHLKVFNEEDLVDRMGEERLARTVALRFAENITVLIQALKDSLKSGDIEAAHRTAHSIKGAAANVGGEALCAVSLRMEEAGMEGRLNDIQNSLPELEDQCVQLLGAISKRYRFDEDNHLT